MRDSSLREMYLEARGRWRESQRRCKETPLSMGHRPLSRLMPGATGSWDCLLIAESWQRHAHRRVRRPSSPVLSLSPSSTLSTSTMSSRAGGLYGGIQFSQSNFVPSVPEQDAPVAEQAKSTEPTPTDAVSASAPSTAATAPAGSKPTAGI